MKWSEYRPLIWCGSILIKVVWTRVGKLNLILGTVGPGDKILLLERARELSFVLLVT